MGRRTKIFISYRRDDASGDARSVYQALERIYGPRRLFMDVDSIKRGRDFRAVLEAHLNETAVILVLIGRQWLGLAGPDGRRRLDDPADFVRLEIATALKDDIAVIPVLIDDVQMPGAADLPDMISGLAYRQASKLRHDSFPSDIADLQKAVKEALGDAKMRDAGSSRVGLIAASVAATLAVGGGALWWSQQPPVPPSAPASSDERVAEPATPPSGETEAQKKARYREIQAALATLGFYRLAVDGDWGAASEAALKRYQTQEGIEPDGKPTRSMQISLRKAAATQAAKQEAAEKEKARLAALHRDIRAELTRLGDFSGSLDGDWNAASETALKRFEKREGLSVRGAPSAAILTTLKKAAKPQRFADRLKAAGEEGLKECDACPAMVAIPGGRFQMGSPEGEHLRDSNEGPQRRVTIQPFALGKYEVTFAEWDSCAADGFCHAVPTKASGGKDNDRGWGRGRRPVMNVSWNDITGKAGDGKKGFLAWLNSKVEGAPYRLPSEAEWEYAARAGSSARWSFGDRESALGDHAWFRGNSGRKTQPVGGKKANAFGLYDVHGNVWEWVEDCWNGSYSGAPKGGSAWNKGDCSRAVLRGGSRYGVPWWLRSAFRSNDPRGDRGSDVGFRVARTLAD